MNADQIKAEFKVIDDMYDEALNRFITYDKAELRMARDDAKEQLMDAVANVPLPLIRVRQ